MVDRYDLSFLFWGDVFMTKGKKTKNQDIVVRVDEEIRSKLNYLSEISGKNRSTVIRELIMEGEVKNIYNGKEIMKDIAQMHNVMNQYVGHIGESIKVVVMDIKDIKSKIQNENIENEKLDYYLDRAIQHLDYLEENFQGRKESCSKILSKWRV